MEREQLNVVFDQVGTPTYAADLAALIVHVLETGKSGNIREFTIFPMRACVRGMILLKRSLLYREILVTSGRAIRMSSRVK